MNINKHLEVINACRFCFMCRHLATLGNVTFKESDTPRGRALILDKIRMDKENLKNQDYIDTVYQATLSAACRYHCVSHYDENGLLLAVRKDIAEAGFAPKKVANLAVELKQTEFAVGGTGEILYYQTPYEDKVEFMDEFKIVSGGDCGKALSVLGFEAEAEEVFTKFKNIVYSSGCETLVVSCPASYDMLKDRLENIKILHISEYLLNRKLPAVSRKAYYLESDFLKNYRGNIKAPRELLKKCGYELIPFGTNPEESYTAGEGAVVYDILYPELTRRLCTRIVELADNPDDDLLITASPYTQYVLKKYAPQLNVISIQEAAREK